MTWTFRDVTLNYREFVGWLCNIHTTIVRKLWYPFDPSLLVVPNNLIVNTASVYNYGIKTISKCLKYESLGIDGIAPNSDVNVIRLIIDQMVNLDGQIN